MNASQRYQRVTLTNTTMAVFMSSLDGMIILIALPAIFNGIHLDPLRARPRRRPAEGNAFHDTGLDTLLRATDARAGPDPDSHRHSLERVFPKLGQTTTRAGFIGFLDRRP